MGLYIRRIKDLHICFGLMEQVTIWFVFSAHNVITAEDVRVSGGQSRTLYFISQVYLCEIRYFNQIRYFVIFVYMDKMVGMVGMARKVYL